MHHTQAGYILAPFPLETDAIFIWTKCSSAQLEVFLFWDIWFIADLILFFGRKENISEVFVSWDNGFSTGPSNEEALDFPTTLFVWEGHQIGCFPETY